MDGCRLAQAADGIGGGLARQSSLSGRESEPLEFSKSQERLRQESQKSQCSVHNNKVLELLIVIVDLE